MDIKRMENADELKSLASSIRHFNRYYTNRLGLLARYRFDTKLSLTEARVLFEIGRRGAHTQRGLRDQLRIDGGYLNRVIKRLAASGLVTARKDESDGRVSVLELSEAGQAAASRIDGASDRDALSLVAGLDVEDCRDLVTHIRAVERILEGRSAQTPLIEAVRGGTELATVRVLMREYAAFLGVDLAFQGFEEELAGLPGKYAPPGGALFLASVGMRSGGTEPAGCVAMRPLGEDCCEMKRLFVRPEYRGYGLGRALARRAIDAAHALGYTKMRLDTLERLEEAVALYGSLGFTRIEPYCENPLPGAMFWEKEL